MITPDKKKEKKISVQLMFALIPMIAAFIILVALILFVNSRIIITREGKEGLEKETKANASDISGTLMDIKGYYNALGDSLEVNKLDNRGIKFEPPYLCYHHTGGVHADHQLGCHYVPCEKNDHHTRQQPYRHNYKDF